MVNFEENTSLSVQSTWSTDYYVSTDVENTSYTTTASSVLKKQDFLEYQISLKINLYLLPIILLIGIPGNVISFVVLVFSTLRKSTTAIYLAVISVLDTLILFISLFRYVASEMPELNIVNTATCKIINFVFYFSIHSNVILVVAVTAERFLVVVFPLKANLWVSKKKTVVVIVCGFLFSFGLNLHHFFIRIARKSKITGFYYCGSTGGNTTRLFLYHIYPWIDSFIYCILPMTSLFVLNIIMMYHMKKNSDRRRFMLQSGSFEIRTNQRQMTTMLLLVSFSFLVLTGPIGIFLVLRRNAWTPTTPKELAVMDLLYSIINNMSYTNHAVNFIFYSFSGQRFRNELKRMCRAVITKKRKPCIQNGVVSSLSI